MPGYMREQLLATRPAAPLPAPTQSQSPSQIASGGIQMVETKAPREFEDEPRQRRYELWTRGHISWKQGLSEAEARTEAAAFERMVGLTRDSDMLAARFAPSTGDDEHADDASGPGDDPALSAARLDMFGTLTRRIQAWRPHSASSVPCGKVWLS